MKRPILAVTMGDPGGIGPEVIARSLQELKPFEGLYLLLIGTSVVFEFLEQELHLKLPLNPIPTLDRAFLRDDSVNLLDVTEEANWLLKRHCEEADALFEIGRVSRINAAMALAALKAGAYQGATGLIDALVTAPVNKEAIRLLEPRFHGHTEYLAKVAHTKAFAMMFLEEKVFPSPQPSPPSGGEERVRGWPLRVTLVTTHVPLKKVSRLITQESVFEKICLTHEFLKGKLKIAKPKIAVAALNPHGREGGGAEESEAIEPAIARAREEKINVEGPLSGDTVFYEAYHGAYDAVVAMYHDQALAPFKLIAFDTGVNLTLGLPYIRTSPDHGTAFDLAYKGRANPRSMAAALACAKNLLLSS